MTQAVEPYRANGAVQRYEAPTDEFDPGLSPDEAKPLRLAWNGRDGQFLDPLTGELTQSIRLVWLRRLPTTRVRFNPNNKAPKEERVLCASDDGLHPRSTAQAAAIDAGGPTHDSCLVCPLKDFTKDRYGNTLRPDCAEILNLAVASDEPEPVPFLFSLKTLARREMLRVLNVVYNKCLGPKLPPFTFVLELSAGPKVTEDNKAYFPLVAKIAGRVPEERREMYATLYHATGLLSGADLATDAADEYDPEPTREPGDGTAERPWNSEELDAELVRRAAGEAPPADESNTAWESLQASAPPHGDPVDQPRRRGRL